MLGPLGLTDDLAVKHEFLFPEEAEHRCRIDQFDAVALRRIGHGTVAAADRRTARFLDAIAVRDGPDAPASLGLRFHDANVDAAAFQAKRCGEAGKSGPNHEDLATVRLGHCSV